MQLSVADRQQAAVKSPQRPFHTMKMSAKQVRQTHRHDQMHYSTHLQMVVMNAKF